MTTPFGRNRSRSPAWAAREAYTHSCPLRPRPRRRLSQLIVLQTTCVFSIYFYFPPINFFHLYAGNLPARSAFRHDERSNGLDSREVGASTSPVKRLCLMGNGTRDKRGRERSEGREEAERKTRDATRRQTSTSSSHTGLVHNSTRIAPAFTVYYKWFGGEGV